jgi:nicotinate-nucleotide pyrophosphorylase (carboxylating)
LNEQNELAGIIRRALEEDRVAEDVTSLWSLSPDQKLGGQFVAKEQGVVAGLEVVREVYRLLDGQVKMAAETADGDGVTPGNVLAEVTGSGITLLGGERVALNFLQRMSGIATKTRRFVEAVRGTNATILDTRKTVPGLRLLDRAAVRAGGGSNHRWGLSDMVLIKDNHISAAGGVGEAIAAVDACNEQDLQVEVEVKTLQELEEALSYQVDRIMLDNMHLEDIRRAVEIVGGRVPLEASGGMTLERVPDVAAAGVDYISVGALTHSVRALDISLEIARAESHRALR